MPLSSWISEPVINRLVRAFVETQVPIRRAAGWGLTKLKSICRQGGSVSLSDRIGVSRQTVIAIENNKYLPSLGLAFKIARLFKVKIEEIFSYPEENEN